MRKYVIGLAVAAALTFAACGESTEEPTTATVTTTTEETAETLEVEVEADRDQEVADQMAKLAPKNLAVICNQTPTLGMVKSEQMFTRILGPEVIKQGATPSGVFDALMEKC